MSRSSRTKHQFTTSEKWLFATPLILLSAAILFFAVKRATSPRVIATELQVAKVVWMGNNKIFTLQQAETQRGAVAFPVSVIYDVTTGEKLAERAWTTRTLHSKISPDGRFWLAGETSDGRTSTSLVLRDLNDFSTVVTLPSTSTIETYNWLDARHFTRHSYHDRSQEQSLWKVDDKSYTVRKVKTLDENSTFIPLSNDGMKVVKIVPGKNTTRWFRSINSNSTSFWDPPAKAYITTLPDEKEIKPLTNAANSRDSWGYAGNVLWRMVSLNNSNITRRYDFLRYDQKTNKTISIRLKDVDKAFPQFDLSYSNNRFSPDCRLWCANAPGSQRWALWDTQTGELVKTIGESPVQNSSDGYNSDLKPQFSNDSKYFFRPTKEGVEIYDTSRFLP